MIQITHSVFLDERALEETFVRASGPGGQNVNKVSTAVQLRVDLARAGLPDPVRARLERLAGSRLTLAGELMFFVQRHRSQERNRAEALDMLVNLIRQACVAPVRRIKTRPTKASGVRRLEAKAHRGRIKQGRGSTGDRE